MTPKPEGRPRDPAISTALLQVAERRMEAVGFGQLTVDGVVSEVGTTRQTFYRRYSSIALLVLEILQSRFSNPAEVNTGKLEKDLLTLQRNDVAMMNTQIIQKNLPGLFEEMRTDAKVRQLYKERIVGPRRQNVADVQSRARARGEIPRTDVDPEYICDLILGSLLARVLLPTDLPIDDRLARQTVATAHSELR
ncbi:TetR-like C-terminal domain-containing protein [Micrococcus luteus]|uniref:TetR-like C-terminal domain-containing protein n=1 Tax=Micrococcus luteus TaxID=1270 RepID=UPI0022A7385B|nr:TetR-like C-terminal domain-containing protein [Micrococcus luteus]